MVQCKYITHSHALLLKVKQADVIRATRYSYMVSYMHNTSKSTYVQPPGTAIEGASEALHIVIKTSILS